MFTIELGEFRLLCVSDGLPDIYDYFCEHARLLEEIALDSGTGRRCFLGVTRLGEEAPALVVAQRFDPGGCCFEPGALVVPETGRLFVGAGERLLAYDLRPEVPRRLWEDEAYYGFQGWRRHGGIVLMSAELELAAWDLEARKLWTTEVEPPWGYVVHSELVTLDVMGRKTEFPLAAGPDSSRPVT